MARRAKNRPAKTGKAKSGGGADGSPPPRTLRAEETQLEGTFRQDLIVLGIVLALLVIFTRSG